MADLNKLAQRIVKQTTGADPRITSIRRLGGHPVRRKGHSL